MKGKEKHISGSKPGVIDLIVKGWHLHHCSIKINCYCSKGEHKPPRHRDVAFICVRAKSWSEVHLMATVFTLVLRKYALSSR